jgi:hypothetical protein
MAAAPLILLGVSALMSASGSVKSAQASANASNYNAQVAEQNRAISASQGEAASQLETRQAEKQMGAAVAGYGASGVQMSEGSPADVLSNNARTATLNNLTTKYNYTLQGLGYQNQAALDRSNASYSSTAGYLSALGSLTGSAAQAYRYGSGGSAIPSLG